MKYSGQVLYSLSGVAVLFSALSCSGEKGKSAKNYNIVYIMTDDHTVQMMSCYDTRYINTRTWTVLQQMAFVLRTALSPIR